MLITYRLKYAPANPHAPNPTKIGNCGNPGPPNSGSSPAVPGNKIAAIPVSQYTLPVKAAMRSESRATSRGVPATSSGRHVRKSVAAPSAIDSPIVWPQWNLKEGGKGVVGEYGKSRYDDVMMWR